MAARKRPSTTTDAAADRRFLASVRGRPGLERLSAPSELSATYVRRVAGELREQTALGRGVRGRPYDLAAARRGARGALRPEHTGRAAPPRTAERQAAVAERRGISREAQLSVTPEGRVDVTVTDRATLIAVIQGALDRGVPALTLGVKVGRGWLEISGGRDGLTPAYVLGVLEGNRDLRGAVRAFLEGRYQRQREEEEEEEPAFGRRRRGAPRRRRRSRRSLAERIDLREGVRVHLAAPSEQGAAA